MFSVDEASVRVEVGDFHRERVAKVSHGIARVTTAPRLVNLVKYRLHGSDDFTEKNIWRN